MEHALDAHATAQVRKLKEEFDGELQVAGSHRLVQELIENDLVDQINLMVFPVILGTDKSDATHFYANLEEDRPFSIVHDLSRMYSAFDLMRSLADSPAHVVPGHDPQVMQRFPPARKGLEGVAVRIA